MIRRSASILLPPKNSQCKFGTSALVAKSTEPCIHSTYTPKSASAKMASQHLWQQNCWLCTPQHRFLGHNPPRSSTYIDKRFDPVNCKFSAIQRQHATQSTDVATWNLPAVRSEHSSSQTSSAYITGPFETLLYGYISPPAPSLHHP